MIPVFVMMTIIITIFNNACPVLFLLLVDFVESNTKFFIRDVDHDQLLTNNVPFQSFLEEFCSKMCFLEFYERVFFFKKVFFEFSKRSLFINVRLSFLTVFCSKISFWEVFFKEFHLKVLLESFLKRILFKNFLFESFRYEFSFKLFFYGIL